MLSVSVSLTDARGPIRIAGAFESNCCNGTTPLPSGASPSGLAGAAGTSGVPALFTAFGGINGFGKPNPPPGGGGRISGPTPGRAGCAWGPPAAGAAGATAPPAPAAGASCAAAGITRIAWARKRSKSVRPKCHCRNALPGGDLRWFIRAQRITLTILGMIIILVGSEMFARQRIALVKEETDPRTGAEHA